MYCLTSKFVNNHQKVSGVSVNKFCKERTNISLIRDFFEETFEKMNFYFKKTTSFLSEFKAQIVSLLKYISDIHFNISEIII